MPETTDPVAQTLADHDIPPVPTQEDGSTDWSAFAQQILDLRRSHERHAACARCDRPLSPRPEAQAAHGLVHASAPVLSECHLAIPPNIDLGYN